MAQERAPQFLVSQESRYQLFRESLSAIWETDPPARSLGLYHSRLWPRQRAAMPALFASALFHFSVAFFLFRVPILLLFHHVARMGGAAEGNHVPQVVYEVRLLKLPDYFPTLQSQGPGGSPGEGNPPKQRPVRGSTAFDPRFSVISNPPHPDNSRLTIVQPSSPPDLKIPFELRLPNVVIGSVVSVPEPPKESPPALKLSAESQNENQLLSRAPSVPLVPASLALATPTPPNPLPHLEVPVSPPPASPEAPQAGNAKGITDLGIPARAPADVMGLLSFSVDAAPLSDSIALPPGNRQGAFSISPAGAQQGSPGGVPSGDLNGGTGGTGTGGETSTGIGSGSDGGGAGGTGADATLSVAGSASPESAVGGGALPSFFAATLVYPVPSPPHPRHSAMIVTAGPAGGGGLRVYGVLRAGKIYTTYLPMPGKSWILQYCARDNAAHNEVHPSRGIEVRLEPVLVPPSAEEQFDFHRPPFSKDKADKMIILHGVIREDGSVGELRILQGLQGIPDEAALAAFGRWKFKPALRAGNPVAVEILVGIPPMPPET